MKKCAPGFVLLAVAFLQPVAGTPLSSRSGEIGASGTAPSMGFTRLDPQKTGVLTENAYADPSMRDANLTIYFHGAIGTGVAVGDFDNDGRPDLFVVSKTESCHLFRNLGDWHFEDVTVRAGIGETEPMIWKQGATFADVNNDGWLDLYLCRFNAPNQLWINRGDGTFREEAGARGVGVRDASAMASFCDYDRDGWLDLYLLTNVLDPGIGPEGQEDYLFRNRGDGTFENVTSSAGIAGPGFGHSATWWDYDEDGWPDLYVANDFAGADRLYRNLGDGKFADALRDAVPYHSYSSMGADTADVNNDGHPDLFVAEMAGRRREDDQRGMAEARAQLNRAGATALNSVPQVMRNTLFLGTGLPRVLEAAELAGLAATDWTWSTRWEDFDCDGWLDLHVTTGMISELHNVDLHARLRTAERPADRIKMLREMTPLPQENLMFRGRGDLQFEEVESDWKLDEKGVSFGVATGDFDGDGDLDLVVAHHGKGVTLHRNDAPAGERLVIDLRGTRSNRYGIGARVTLSGGGQTQSRTLTLARGYLSSSEPAIFFGLGGRTQAEVITITWPSGAVQTLRNVPSGQRLTITEPRDDAMTAVSDSALQQPLFRARTKVPSWTSGGFAAEADQPPLKPWRIDQRGPFIAVGDRLADGTRLLAIGGTPTAPARIYAVDHRGRLSAPSSLPDDQTKVNDGPVLIADLNEDGNADVLITRGGSSAPAGTGAYAPTLLLGSSTGTFTRATPADTPPITGPVGALAAADFDGNGHDELFVGGRTLARRYPEAVRSALYSRAGSSWEDVTERVQPALKDCGLVNAAVACDVDGDGWIDLLTVAEWGGVRFWKNRNGKLEDFSTRYGFSGAGTGLWTCLSLGDFNRDGRPDFAIGNLGVNTPYHATREQPVVLYSGAFKGQGTPPVLVEAVTDAGQLWPRRSRNELASAIPEIGRKYPKNDLFAQASLEEIVGQDRLKASKRWEVTELRSGVFLSNAQGSYDFTPFPRMAQLSVTESIVAGDFDHDGVTDLCLAQNNRNALPSTGPFEGALSVFLKGKGDGSFEAVPPLQSGFHSIGPSAAAAGLDTEDGSTVLLARPDGSCIGFLATKK